MDNGSIVKKDKYWITPGLTVKNTHWPSRKMVVTQVIQKSQKHGSDASNTRTRMKGVICHWIDDNGGYQSGQFHSSELESWD